MLHLLQGTRSEQPPEFLEGAKRPLSSNWAPTGIAITRENSWIPEVHGSLKSRSGQLCALKSPLAHLTSLGPLSKISWGCSLSKRKDERWKPGLWPPQAQQEPWPKQEEGPAAGQEGSVRRNFGRCRWNLETSIGALLAAQRLAFIDQPDQIYWRTIFHPHKLHQEDVMLLLVCISIALEGANVCMNRHEGKLLAAQHETVRGVKLPASCLYHPVNLMPSVWPYPRIIVFIPNKKRGDFKINIYF